MKKNIPFTTTLFAMSLGCVGHLQADVSDAQMRNLENRVSVLEQKKGSNAMVNPPGRPQVQDGIDVFVTAEWLIWQAHENGLGYAVKNQENQTLETALYNSSVKNLHWDWDSGVRVGLGYNLPHDGWDVVANWTWFQNKAKGNVTANSSDLFSSNPFEIAETDTLSYSSASSKLWLRLNFIDLDLGREFFVSKWMTLRPFMGLRTSWVRQTLSTTYNTPIPVSSTASFFSQGKNNYWGLGLRSGLNTQWGLGAGFSFFGNASISLMNGYFQVSDMVTSNFTSGQANINLNNNDSFRVGRVFTDLAMGLRYDTMVANDRCHLGFWAGWEQTMLFGMNQFKHFYGTFASNAGGYFANQGDLTLQGWTLSARVDF